MSASTPRCSYQPRWSGEKMLERQQYWKEKTLERHRRHHLEFQSILDSIYKYPSKQAELNGIAEYLEWERQFELVEQAIKKNPISPASEPCRNMASPKFAGEQADLVPPSVEELGIPLELAEQDEQDFNEEQTVSPAPETDEQANSVPPSVDQQGTLLAPKIRPYHARDCPTHMAPANSPADFVPSRVWIMDFRNLQYRRHVKHLVDHTDVASMGSNTINTSDYACSS